MKLLVLSKQRNSPTEFDKIKTDYVEMVFIKNKVRSYLCKRLVEENPGLFDNMEILMVRILNGGGCKYK